MKLRDLLVLESADVSETAKDAVSWFDIDNSLLETQILDVVLSPLTYTMGVFLEVRTSEFFHWEEDSDHNAAVPLSRQVENLE